MIGLFRFKGKNDISRSGSYDTEVTVTTRVFEVADELEGVISFLHSLAAPR